MAFRRIAEETLVEGSLVTLGRGTYEAPDGRRFEREVVHHPGAVVVVPLLEGSQVLAVRQFRAPVGRSLLEIPAGKRDRDGEPPERTAARGLIEEVGHRAGRLEKLGEFYNSPGFCDEYSHLYLATELTEVGTEADGIEEEHLEIVTVALEDVPDLVAAGELVDAKTIIGLCLARSRLAS